MILERLVRETGITAPVLAQIIKTASHRYKTYHIKKKSGGSRTISQPTPQVKYLQRWVVKNLILVLPVHNSVTSYKRGMGIAENARRHSKYNYLLRIDFKDFFPSIKAEDVRGLLHSDFEKLSSLGFDEADIELVVSITCRFGSLSIGAPSSPAISNAVLFEFDKRIYEYCERNQLVYTRYADDLCFSTDVPNRLSEVLQFVKDDLVRHSLPKLFVNVDKTIFTSKKRRRAITGVILTPTGILSVGRKKKRALRSMIFSYRSGILKPSELMYLRGYLSYARSVEPDMLARLRKKYGDEVLEKIMTT